MTCDQVTRTWLGGGMHYCSAWSCDETTFRRAGARSCAENEDGDQATLALSLVTQERQISKSVDKDLRMRTDACWALRSHLQYTLWIFEVVLPKNLPLKVACGKSDQALSFHVHMYLHLPLSSLPFRKARAALSFRSKFRSFHSPLPHFTEDSNLRARVQVWVEFRQLGLTQIITLDVRTNTAHATISHCLRRQTWHGEKSKNLRQHWHSQTHQRVCFFQRYAFQNKNLDAKDQGLRRETLSGKTFLCAWHMMQPKTIGRTLRSAPWLICALWSAEFSGLV